MLKLKLKLALEHWQQEQEMFELPVVVARGQEEEVEACREALVNVLQYQEPKTTNVNNNSIVNNASHRIDSIYMSNITQHNINNKS